MDKLVVIGFAALGTTAVGAWLYSQYRIHSDPHPSTERWVGRSALFALAAIGAYILAAVAYSLLARPTS